MMASHTTLEEKFVELLKAKQTDKTSRPKIQKVDEFLRKRSRFERQYSPKFVSIGPIHYDNENLKFGENFKLTWAAKYIQTTQLCPQLLHGKIAYHIDELKSLFADDVLAITKESLKGFHSLEEKLSWVLFLDGCFLLHIMLNLKRQLEKQKDVNIEVELVLVMTDVLLLENQLPYLVLKLLWKNDYEYELIDTLVDFLKYYHLATPDKKTWRSPNTKHKFSSIVQKTKTEHVVDLHTPTHLLDLQRKIILSKTNPKIKANNEANKEKKEESWEFSEIKSKMMTYRNIEDLTAVGVNLRSSGTRRPTDVDFSEGWFTAELTLPEIVVDDDTAASFLNLIAYEMCPDFENDYGICSFLVFIHSLIDHAEDVKKLRSKGILVNSFGSDEEISELFSILSTDLVYDPKTYFNVRVKIHKHHFKRSKIWLAQGYQTYFSNPWAITGFLAAFIALALTCLQTWFSIFPR